MRFHIFMITEICEFVMDALVLLRNNMLPHVRKRQAHNNENAPAGRQGRRWGIITELRCGDTHGMLNICFRQDLC